jgi:hypothetical protein
VRRPPWGRDLKSRPFLQALLDDPASLEFVMTRPLCLTVLLALTVLAPLAASAQTRTELLDRALVEAARVRDPAQQALALAEVAQVAQSLADTRWEKALADSVAAAGLVEEPVAKAMSWRGLFARTRQWQPELARQLLDRALRAARDLPYAAHRSVALREIGRALAELDKAESPAVFVESLAAAEKIESPLFRAAALRDLATAWQRVDAAQAHKLFAQAAVALAAVQPADDPVQLARVELVVAWSTEDLTTALTEAAAIPDERLRETCLRRIVEALAPTDAEAALQVVEGIRDSGQRALAMAALAEALAATQAEASAGMARSALELGAGLLPEDLARLQSAVALALARLDLKESLALVATIADEGVAGQTVGRVAEVVAQSDPALAAQIAAKIEDGGTREAAEAQLAPLLAINDLPAALKLIDGLLSRRAKVRALLQVIAVVNN